MKNSVLQILGILMITCSVSCNSSKIPSSATIELVQYNIEDVESLMKNENKPIAIFLHAAWCQYCNNMEQTTFKNQDVIKSLNEDFYYFSFDGESRDDVTFKNRTYHYLPSGRNSGVHELAVSLGNMDGTLTYPTFVILDSELEIIFQHNAYLSSKEMYQVLRTNS